MWIEKNKNPRMLLHKTNLLQNLKCKEESLFKIRNPFESVYYIRLVFARSGMLKSKNENKLSDFVACHCIYYKSSWRVSISYQNAVVIR